MKTLATTLFVSILATSFVVATLPGQGKSSQGFVLMAGDHDIVDIISKAATFLGRNLIIQQEELAGNHDTMITLQKSLNLDVMGCEEVVSQLAWLKGLVMSPVDPKRGIYEFINVRINNLRGQKFRAVRATFLSPEKIVKRPQLKRLVSTSLRLGHIDATRAAQYLLPMIARNSPSGLRLSIGSLGTRHALMLKGLSDQVANAIEMVSMMDIPEAEDNQPTVHEQLAGLEKEKAELRSELEALRKRVRVLEGRKK